jgi:hypothetical protein
MHRRRRSRNSRWRPLLAERVYRLADATGQGQDPEAPGLMAYYFGKRKALLGPEHDWSSHGSDAFGLMCVAYEDPARTKSFNRAINYGGATSCNGRHSPTGCM